MPDTIDPCKEQREESDEALDDFRDAGEDRRAARETLDDEESVFDGSNIATGAAGAGAVIACVSTPFGWLACGTALLIGGVSVYASESERLDDIEAAREALEDAERDYWKANRRWQKAMRREMHCRHHNQLTGQPA